MDSPFCAVIRTFERPCSAILLLLFTSDPIHLDPDIKLCTLMFFNLEYVMNVRLM